MVILQTQSEFGEAPPPQTPYSIISNIPKWEVNEKIRDGDMSIVSKLKHIYPRFGPTHYVGQVRSQSLMRPRSLLPMTHSRMIAALI